MGVNDRHVVVVEKVGKEESVGRDVTEGGGVACAVSLRCGGVLLRCDLLRWVR